MSITPCFYILDELAEEASKNLGALWRRDEDLYDILKQYCDIIDTIIDECNCESYKVEIDDETNNIAISIKTPWFCIPSGGHVFYELAKRTIATGFVKSEDGDNVCVKFVFPSIWRNVV